MVLLSLCDHCVISDEWRLNAFTLSVGNSSDIEDHSQCTRHNGAVAAGATVNESCTATGRYLSFRLSGGEDNHFTTLCEVVVIGYIYVCKEPLVIILRWCHAIKIQIYTYTPRNVLSACCGCSGNICTVLSPLEHNCTQYLPIHLRIIYIFKEYSEKTCIMQTYRPS